ncbi:MAG: hypothetical protein JW871_02360 [Endomicrobiales bacterium]|nr:hypothetical protein [Endomicrobiales bacterium]
MINYLKLFMLLMLILPINCFGDEGFSVFVIMKTERNEYSKVVTAFKKYLSSKQMLSGINTYYLQNEKANKILNNLNKNKKNLFLIFGSDVLEEVQGSIPGDVPIITAVVDYKGIQPANVTGIKFSVPSGLKIQEIRRIIPQVKTYGVLYSQESMYYVDEISQACSRRNIKLVKKQVTNENLAGALESILNEIDCFLIIPDNNLYNLQTLKFVLLQSLSKKVPCIGLSRYFTKAGALASIESDCDEMGVQTGEIAESIYSGKSPSSIKIQQPRKAEYSLNLLIAEKLGIKFPDGILDGASEVFK